MERNEWDIEWDEQQKEEKNAFKIRIKKFDDIDEVLKFINKFIKENWSFENIQINKMYHGIENEQNFWIITYINEEW